MKKIAILCISVLFFLSGCSQSSTSDDKPSYDFNAEIILSLNNLPPLTDAHYEGWVFADGKAHSIGKFLVTEDGSFTDLSGTPIPENIFEVSYAASKRADRFMVTLEPNGDDNPERSFVSVVEGNFEPVAQSPLYFSGYDTESMTGTYQLRTFSDQGVTASETSGLWFVTFDGTKRSSSLDLPSVRPGWIYEAWIKKGDAIVSLGKFESVKSADLSSRFNRQVEELPKYPGEDFLQDPEGISGIKMPTNLADGSTEVFITFEPYISGNTDLSGDSPFPFTLLEAQIPRNAKRHTDYNLVNVAVNHIPSGVIQYIPASQ